MRAVFYNFIHLFSHLLFDPSSHICSLFIEYQALWQNIEMWIIVTNDPCPLSLTELKRKLKLLVAQSCPTLSDPMDHRPPRLLCSWDSPGKNSGVKWVAVSFSRGSSRLRGQILVSCIAGRFFTIWAPAMLQLNCVPLKINALEP